MPAFLAHARRILVRALEIMVMVIMGVLVIDVTWQVFTRFVMNNPSSWTEELATILMMWVALLGASVGFLRSSHLGVDYFVNKLPGRPRSLVACTVHLIVAFFAVAILVYGGGRLVYLTLMTNQLTPALGLKRGFVYLVLPLSGCFIFLFAIEQFIEEALSFGTKSGGSKAVAGRE